jgi:hypothetical protein
MWEAIQNAVADIQSGKYNKAVLSEFNVFVYRCATIIRIDIKKQEVK